MEAVKEVRARRDGGAAEGARPRPLLSLDEIRASGLPAYFHDHGEELLFLDGELFDLREAEAAQHAGKEPQPLPREILENGVGIEYGWRHVPDCVCHYCWQRALEAAGEAVA
jgi:hypothetical protein